MLRAETAMHAAPPASYKRKIQRAPDCRASERNQSPNPLFHGLGANLCGEALRNARDQFFENLFFSQILAVIDARSRRRRLPHFDALVVAASFKSVQQRKALDEPKRNHREQAGIRQERDHAAKAKARSLRKRQPFGIANQRCSDAERLALAEGADRKSTRLNSSH